MTAIEHAECLRLTSGRREQLRVAALVVNRHTTYTSSTFGL